MRTPRAVVISNDEPDSSYGAGRLSSAVAHLFETETISPLGGFPNPGAWLSEHGADALVISGSDRSVRDELPWMLEQEELLRVAVSMDLPILAICFGHQLLAKAFGAEIVTREKRIGLFEVRPVGEDPVFAGIGERAVVPEQHSDQIGELPQAFSLIATSDYCVVQAFRHREALAYGMQFHPCYDGGVFDEDEAWAALDVRDRFEHDGALILGNAARLMWEHVRR